MRLSPEQLTGGWEQIGRGSDTPSVPVYKLYSPLTEAAHSYVRWAQSPHKRVFTGIQRIDDEMRGIAPGELSMIIGYSHGGKTLALMHTLSQNRDKKVAFFIPDEPKTLILTKLTCMYHGVDARDLERRVAEDDKSAIELLRRTAEEDFPNLAVFDQPLVPSDMERAYGEVSDVWGQEPDLVVVDYLELVENGETVPEKANFVKAFGRRHDVPMLVLHQTSRSSGAEGKKLTMSSGSYGGEQQATSIIGVRRKKYEIMAELNELTAKMDRNHTERTAERIEFLRYELGIHDYTLTVSLLKNKRPGGQLVDDVDFELDIHTGQLHALRNGELPDQYLRNAVWKQEPLA
jgi:KaiC/GvpD/RAD55 family RecA-like ATPase